MIRDRIQPVLDWLKRAVTRPRAELTEWETRARFAYDLGRHGVQQLKEDRAPHMAAALAFRTLFALLPVLIVSSVLFKGLRGIDRLKELVSNLVESAGLHDVQVAPADPVAAGEAGPAPPEVANTEPVSLGSWIEQLVAQVGELNLETLGWIGLAVMVYAAIAMMVTIENCFNTIYRAPEGRSWLRRLPTYWTILTLGPLTIGLLFFFDTSVDAAIRDTAIWPWVITVLKGIWNLAVLWLFMFGFYLLVPHTQVGWRPAMIGAFVAALLLLAGKAGMGWYVGSAMTLSYLYGAIGLVPILMLWVYVMWLFVLFGLEVSATLQSLGGRQLDEVERKSRRTGLVDPASILVIMEVIADHFTHGRAATVRKVAEDASVPESTAASMVDLLVNEGLLHRLDRDEATVTLACPPDQISADELIRVGFRLVDETAGGRKSSLADRLREAQTSLVSNMSLASLIGPRPAASAANQESGRD